MVPEISEFSYGFALVDELIHWHNWPLTAVPIYPSLRKEAHLGYDAVLQRGGIPVFFQFKLSHCMVRNSAREVEDGYFFPPIYRMHLRPRGYSQQHALLIDLESKGNEVYYAAPVFHLPSELNDAYLNHEIHNRSRFFRPSKIGSLPDYNPHYLAFQQSGDFVFYSQPIKKEGALDGKGLDEELLAIVNRKGKTALTPDALGRLSVQMVAILRRFFEGVADNSPLNTKREIEQEKASLEGVARLEPLEQIGYLARIYFGCELLVVTNKEFHKEKK